MNISIFGLGYVGSVSAACFAKLGHNVIGVDISKEKVKALNKCEPLIKEKGLNELLKECKDKITATTETIRAVHVTDISFVCVGTPPKQNGDIDLTSLKNVCMGIGKALKTKKGHHTIAIRSTTFPGTLPEIIKVIEKASGKGYPFGFNVVINPEFLREGSAIEDFFNPPFIIVGAGSNTSGQEVLDCYGTIAEKSRYIVKPEIAQMIKYANNSWHGLKVCFTNEIAAVCKKLDIDAKKLMSLFCLDHDLNLSSYYMKPGFAYGGSCIQKEISCLKNEAKKLGLKCSVIDSITPSNMEQINRAIQLIEKQNKKSIGFLGITFKAGSDDIRSNPILFVINKLLNKKYNIKIYDKLIGKENLKNISKSYRKEVYDLVNLENLKTKVKDISKLFASYDDVMEQDIIVISTRDKSLREEIMYLPKGKIIIDLQNIFDSSDTQATRINL